MKPGLRTKNQMRTGNSVALDISLITQEIQGLLDSCLTECPDGHTTLMPPKIVPDLEPASRSLSDSFD